MWVCILIVFLCIFLAVWLRLINPLIPLHLISIHILLTDLSIFHIVLTRRIYLTIRAVLIGDNFLYSCNLFIWFKGLVWGEIRSQSLIGFKGSTKRFLCLMLYVDDVFCFVSLVCLDRVIEVRCGQQTKNFVKFPYNEVEEQSFSLMFEKQQGINFFICREYCRWKKLILKMGMNLDWERTSKYILDLDSAIWRDLTLVQRLLDAV